VLTLADEGGSKLPVAINAGRTLLFYSGNENLNRKPSNRLAQICANRYHRLRLRRKASADLRDLSTPAEHRKSTAEAAKATGASTRA